MPTQPVPPSRSQWQEPPAAPDDAPAPVNRAARRKKGKPADLDPAAAAARYRGSAGHTGPAQTTAQGRRVNPVRRTG